MVFAALAVLAIALVVMSLQLQGLRTSDNNIVESNVRQEQAIEQLRNCIDADLKPCPASVEQ